MSLKKVQRTSGLLARSKKYRIFYKIKLKKTGYLQDSTIELNYENIALLYNTSSQQWWGQTK